MHQSFCKVRDLRFGSPLALTLRGFRRGCGAAGALTHAAVDASAPGGCPASGLGSQPAARLAPTRCGEGQSRSWWPFHSVSPEGWAPAALPGLRFCSRGGDPAAPSWRVGLLAAALCLASAPPAPHRLGSRAVDTVGPASLGSCPRALASAAAWGFSTLQSGTWGRGVGGPAPLGSPQACPLFSGSWFSSGGH